MVQKYPSCLARIADGRVLQRRGGAGEQRRAGGVPGRRVKEIGGEEGGLWEEAAEAEVVESVVWTVMTVMDSGQVSGSLGEVGESCDGFG